MYSFESKVRYSEIGTDKKLSLSSLINYFQDCSTFQSLEIGKGIDYLEDNHRIWLMNAWQIVIERLPELGEAITAGTWAYDFKGMYGYRNFVLYGQDEKLCAAANSIWILMDNKLGRPVRIEEEDRKGYPMKDKYPMEYAPRKIDISGTGECKEAFAVVSSNIDTNQHVNNAQYIKMAEGYLPENFIVRQMRAEYRMSAVLGDLIIPRICIAADKYTIILENNEQKPFAIVEFTSASSQKLLHPL